MASTSVPADIYPFATQDGQAIPLDIIRPLSVYVTTLSDSTDALIVIPSVDTNLAAIHSNVDALIKFDSEITSMSGLIEKALFCKAGTIIIASLPSLTMYAQSFSGSGTLVIQLIQKWAGLSLPRQYQKK